MCCGINKCDMHKSCTSHPGHRCCNLVNPCTIQLRDGFLLLHSHSVTFRTKHQSIHLYQVKYPFTRNNLLALNVIDSQEPDAYVMAIKKDDGSIPERQVYHY